MNIEYKLLTETATVPTLATQGAAGFDLYADLGGITQSRMILSGGRGLFKTGIAMAIPPGFVGLICPRSGLSLRNGITVHNGPGVIDSDYRDDIGVILHNTTELGFVIRHGDRIAQIVFVEIPSVTLSIVEDLTKTDRGLGGFGSTGQ